ncbi:glycosyl hydrolase [Actinomycetota bacterium]|nr:glycosyl hydrolase [Actinomycetota bacterium]
MTATVLPASAPRPARRVRVRPRALDGGAATVTVVVPCHDYARFLPAAVGSALAQEGVTVDVVVVDDASTDDSLAVAHALARADARVRVLEHPVNQGPVRTFNDGLAVATGEFLVRLDADDLLTPGSLARSVALARAYPTVGLVYGHPVHFVTGGPGGPGGPDGTDGTDGTGGTGGPAPGSARTRARSWTVWPGHEWLARRCAEGHNVITSPEVLMRSAVVARVGGQQPLAHTHDMEMWLRVAAFSDVAYVGGADQAWHREHAASLSARKVDQMVDLRERLAAFDTLFAGQAREVRGASGLHETARRALALEALGRLRYELDRGRRRPGLADELFGFARAAWEPVVDEPQWDRLRRRVADGRDPAWGRIAATARVGWARVDDRLRARRWATRGEY